MRFAKYQGTGNDFVMLLDLEDATRLTPELVRRLCDRRFGIGADGLIRVAPSERSDFFMDYVNSDGSIGEMCGNGIRCLARFVHDEGVTNATTLDVDTRAGQKTIGMTGDLVRVDMGAPSFLPAEIPVLWDGPDALHAKLEVDDGLVEAACLSMGNPHAVLFVDDPARAPVTTLGPVIERNDAFPHGANVEFVMIESPERIRMRVWERGSGETLACGTGACAAAVAARLLGGAAERVTVALPGGELHVEWPGSLEAPAPVVMTGPAVKSFEGDVDLGALGT